ncbi:MAG: PadR family transcriptional regulator [Bacilli bacterium]|nr:PadR family transcriptional regulator [Bacilli bacterium]
MNIQFKKGVLELIVLVSVSKKDMYGYELISLVSKVVDVNDGTIYPLLKRLTNERYCETYLVESTEGPPRKYYKITILGKERLDNLLTAWNDFQSSVNKYIKESVYNDKK